MLAALYLLAASTTFAQSNLMHRYLFIGHPRGDVPPRGPSQVVQRPLEHLDYTEYDLLMLGGDLTWDSSLNPATAATYLDTIFDLHEPSRFLALGNHDAYYRPNISRVTGRPASYAFKTNSITFMVLDTTDTGHNIQGSKLTMLRNTVASLSNCTHLIVISHHFIWMADYAPLAHLKHDPRIAVTSRSLSGLNFYSEVYPELLHAQTNGVQVIWLSGDRTGDIGQEFHIEHTTSNGIHYLAAGLKEQLPEDKKSVIIFEHDEQRGELTWEFTHVSELPRKDVSPVIVNEIHYHPPDSQGDDASFIELYNRSEQTVDLSNAEYVQGISFTFPSGVTIDPHEYIVIAADSNRYADLGVQVFDWTGNGRPSPSEPIQIRSIEGFELDYVPFVATNPWPTSPDGLGPSLMLIEATRDNELATNWRASDQILGSAGQANLAPLLPTALNMSTSGLNVVWSGSVSGAHYQVYSTTQLLDASWQPIGTVITARTDVTSFLIPPNPFARRAFYRVGRNFD
jgi:predicted phosphohydrolase